LRNPLAPIRAAVDLFLVLGPDNPVLKRATDTMARQITHITRLVDDLLDVARISRGKVELKHETCDIVQIVTHTVEDYRPTIEASGVEVHIQAPSQAVWVDGDSARLAQIVGNLLHNAAKFTLKGNRIKVEVREEADRDKRNVSICVKDDGAGMTPQLVATLFNPFAQATQELGRSTGGLGLGLSLVKGLAELHGGRVTAQSAGPGLGSSFTVCLPAAGFARQAVITNRNTLDATGLRIVAIDDHKDALEMLSLLLAVNRHEVTMAYDGPSGLASVKSIRPDAVICDIGLPGKMSGYDVAQAIRSDRDLADTLVIALSGYGQESDRKRATAAGFDAHLVKPARHQDLENMLKRARPGKVMP
jgi:CheY-like chemotaxis protein/two-component sensor histidine kinase